MHGSTAFFSVRQLEADQEKVFVIVRFSPDGSWETPVEIVHDNSLNYDPYLPYLASSSEYAFIIGDRFQIFDINPVEDSHMIYDARIDDISTDIGNPYPRLFENKIWLGDRYVLELW